MEFKEFENPEESDYDIKSGSKNVNPSTIVVENSLNVEEGIDLNAPQFYNDGADNQEPNFQINEFGEIIRPEGKSK